MFGKAFASKPDQFQFLPGNRTVIEVIYEISKNLVDAMPPKRQMLSTFLTVPTTTFRSQILIQNVTVFARSVDS